MKMTIRTSVFETNSSSLHTFVYVSKKTFDEWKRGEKILVEGCLYKTYGEDSFMTTEEWEKCGKPIGCTFEELSEEEGDCASFIGDHVKIVIWGPGSYDAAETVICTDKETFEAWKRGEVILNDGSLAEMVYGCDDFIRIEKESRWIDTYAQGGTYKDILEYYSKIAGEKVLKRDAKEKYVDPEEWKRAEDDHLVYQNKYMETEDDGKNVTVRIWGGYTEQW